MLKRRRKKRERVDEDAESWAEREGRKQDKTAKLLAAHPTMERKVFKPTTPEELRMIHKRARRKERAAKREKLARKESRKPKQPRYGGERLREALVNQEQFRIYRANLFDKFIEFCKECGIPKPRYRSYIEPERSAQGQFIYEVHSALSRMSWTQLTELLHAAVTTDEKPVGVATRTWSQALSYVRHCLHVALGVREKKGTLRLADSSVLDDWPVSERKRKSSKEDDSMLTEELELERRNAAMLAASRKKDEDEDDEEVDEDEDEDEDEDDDEDEDEDDDDEDEDDEDDDDEDEDEDDEDEDDDDEPKGKKGKAAKGKKKSSAKKGFGSGRKRKAAKDEDDEDEDDEDEDDEDADDEDDDDSPKRGKGKSTKKDSTVKGKKKRARASDDDESTSKKRKAKGGKKASSDDDAPRRTRSKAVELEASTVLKFAKKRPAGGPKTELLALIPKKGITLKKLTAAAKEEGLPTGKVERWASMFVKRGFATAD